MCDEKKKPNLQALLAEAATLAAPLAGKAPEGVDFGIWSRRAWVAAQPKLKALADLKDMYPADPEPLQGAFLLARYNEIRLAGLIPPDSLDASSVSPTALDNPFTEPDPLGHAAKHRSACPGVDKAVAAYVAWREGVAELGAAEKARVAEKRAEIEREMQLYAPVRGTR